MRVEINNLKIKMRQQETFPVSTELRINEIPFTQQENLSEKFQRIYNTKGTPIPNLKTIYRLRNHNNKHNETSKEFYFFLLFKIIGELLKTAQGFDFPA